MYRNERKRKEMVSSDTLKYVIKFIHSHVCRGGVDLKKPKKIGDFENLPDVLNCWSKIRSSRR